MGWKTNEVEDILSSVISNSITIFCDKGEKVLTLVEQTGSSLQRFKKKMTGRQSGATSEAPAPQEDSDDFKIRTQLALDAQYVKEEGEKHPTVKRETIERLDAFQQRAKAIDAV